MVGKNNQPNIFDSLIFEPSAFKNTLRKTNILS